MRELSFQRATALSFFLHVAFLVLAVLLTRNASDRMPTIYTVRIVTPEAPRKAVSAPKPKEVSRPENRQKVAPKQKADSPPEPAVRKKPAPPPEEDFMALEREKAERLRALKAKQDEKLKEQKLEEIEERLRTEQVQKVAETRNLEARETLSQGERSKVLADYSERIQAKIREYWVFPDIDLQHPQAVVSVTVRSSGAIIINRFEKTSGNAVFDRSALKAISRAGRVEPPPFGRDLEIGLVFSPDEK